MDGRFLAHDAAGLRLGLALMALDHVDALHQGTTLVGKHLEHFAFLALVAAGSTMTRSPLRILLI